MFSKECMTLSKSLPKPFFQKKNFGNIRAFVLENAKGSVGPISKTIKSFKQAYDLTDILYVVLLIMVFLNIISLVILQNTLQEYQEVLGQLIEAHKVNYQLKQDLLRINYQEKLQKVNLEIPNDSQTYWARLFGITGLIFMFALGAYFIYHNVSPPPVDPEMTKVAFNNLWETENSFKNMTYETNLRDEWITIFHKSHHVPIKERNFEMFGKTYQVLKDCMKERESIQSTVVALLEKLNPKK